MRELLDQCLETRETHARRLVGTSDNLDTLLLENPPGESGQVLTQIPNIIKGGTLQGIPKGVNKLKVQQLRANPGSSIKST